MDVTDLRIALFSGNYNMTLDGANKALNRLAEYLMRRGAALRVYSPTIDTPAFEPQGDLVSLPSIPIPGRSEYRVPLGLDADTRDDLAVFAPNMVHIASPDFSARAAVKWARGRDIPVLASVHTRFETYPRFYRMGFLEPVVEAYLRGIYRKCDALVTPSQSMVDTLHDQHMHDDVTIWSRGVDRSIFDSAKRDPEWRRGLGLEDCDVAIAFLGRLVMEKGLGMFADTMDMLRERGVPHKVLVIGDGPARAWFEKAMPDAIFAGFQTGPDLGRALASADIFFNPSVTETFGNVTLEAMASGLPVVAAGATGSASLVADGETGALVDAGSPEGFADAISPYCRDDALRHAHGAAGERASRAYSWDAINQAVVDTYLRLHREAKRGADR
ncbi:glycosyltransferase family 1 protein [Erythrobacter sp. A6_0]|uniref:glycosyltransferase family 4 protein n=1 Tax=Erythrobacter sp. A6_0 TaxID=2821089 RepID=UPI001ADB51BF|nr:glycosyltransferase family 1 protein [Erythrobacter sp. A6_0]MBO9511218.1 glycosyltransferase family 1 protein [Erythrobacter sp. A6_0]